MNAAWRDGVRKSVRGAVLSLAALLAGCEGATTGREIATVALQPATDGQPGGYAPVSFTLSPDMNPVAFNLRADIGSNPAEQGKWNSYRATLQRGDRVVTEREFNLNHPASGADSAPPASVVETLFYVDVDAAGEYRLTLTLLKPPSVTLSEARMEVRRNVQRPPQ